MAKQPNKDKKAQPAPAPAPRRGTDPFVKMLVGTLAGVVFGLLAGRSLVIQWGDAPIEMDIPGAMIGAIIGFTIARLMAGKGKTPSAAEEQPKK